MRWTALATHWSNALEQRYIKAQIHSMMASAGLKDIVFSDKSLYWCGVAYRSQ